MLKFETQFDENLKSRPVDITDFTQKVDQEIASLQLFDIENEELTINFISRAGILAQNLSYIDRFDEALYWIEITLKLAHKLKDHQKVMLVNTLRRADILRLFQKYDLAQKDFSVVFDLIKNNSQLHEWLDFAYQHLGKLYFDQKLYSQALEQFIKAKDIRLNKNDPSLLASTDLAIKTTQQKLNRLGKPSND